MLSRKLKKSILIFEGQAVNFLGGVVIKPLKGIPGRIGKKILYFNYAAALLIMLIFGYQMLIHSISDLAIMKIIASSYFNMILFIILPVFIVVIFSPSIVVIFEIINIALKKYPQIRYTRIKIKKSGEIAYYKKQIERT